MTKNLILFLNQLKWQFLILQRSKLIFISIIITVLYSMVFQGLKSFGEMDKLLTLLIYNDPAIIGLFFMGLLIIMEKNQGVFSALFVSPQNIHHYLLSKIIALSVVGTLCGLGMGISALGFSFDIFQFSIGVFFTCITFSCIGIILASKTIDFLKYMLVSIPFLIFFSLPLFNYFNLTDIYIFNFLPIQGSLNLIIFSQGNLVNSNALYLSYFSLVVWSVTLYLFSYKYFQKNLKVI